MRADPDSKRDKDWKRRRWISLGHDDFAHATDPPPINSMKQPRNIGSTGVDQIERFGQSDTYDAKETIVLMCYAPQRRQQNGHLANLKTPRHKIAPHSFRFARCRFLLQSLYCGIVGALRLSLVLYPLTDWRNHPLRNAIDGQFLWMLSFGTSLPRDRIHYLLVSQTRDTNCQIGRENSSSIVHSTITLFCTCII